MSATEIEFVDALPTVQRGGRTGGVWGERLEPLRENPGKWALVYRTTAPHAMVANLSGGKVQGFDPDEFQFAGRVVGTKEVEVDVKDEDTGEVIGTDIVEKDDGHVYARFVTPEILEAEAEAEADEDDSDS